jgi:ATP-dependent DNA ligase
VTPQLTGLPTLIEPMTARAVAVLPPAARAGSFGVEIKADGWRALAVIEAGRVRLQSRQQRPLTNYFPEIVAGVLEQVPDGTALDGELVVHRGGRFDFTALQRRIHPAAMHAARRGAAAPATLMVFDVLALAGVDLRAEPYLARRERLEQLLGDARPPLVLMPMTRDRAVAEAWLHEHAAAGVEGVVLKHLQHAYLPRRRWWGKIRTTSTVEAVVYGVTGTPTVPQTLVLALPQPDGALRVAGRTSALPPAARAELGALLNPSAGVLPLGALPAWHSGGRRPEYTAVEPTVVVEVRADVAVDGGVWRHATRFLRWRADLTPADLAPAPC